MGVKLATRNRAFSAADTLCRRICDDFALIPGLRILAPETAKRTAYQEKSCPNAGTIVYGIVFDIKYARIWIHIATIPRFTDRPEEENTPACRIVGQNAGLKRERRSGDDVILPMFVNGDKVR